MRKWLRRVVIVVVPGLLILAGLYEAATHVGRSWLSGEAFYEGRPTSWWRGRIDEWMERFDSADDGVRSIGLVAVSDVLSMICSVAAFGDPSVAFDGFCKSSVADSVPST